MATQQIYFDNPNTISNIANNVTVIATGTSNINQGRPYGFKSQYITSVQSLVPDYEWEMRKSIAKVSRALVQFGAKEGFMSTTCNANHVSARIPTGWRDPYTPISGTPYTVSTVAQPYKFCTVPSPYEVGGLPTNPLSSYTGALSPTGGTQDLRDLDPATLNTWVLMPPGGCYMDECSASSLLKLDAKTGTASVTFTLPAQQWMKDRGYSVASAAPVQHLPLFLNDPRCNAVCHSHGIFEAISGIRKGLYPLSFIQQIFTHADYYEFPGAVGAEVASAGDVGRIVAQNYVNFLAECNRIGRVPTSAISLSKTMSSLDNSVFQPNWETKNVLIAKQHGANIWGNNPEELQCYVPFFLRMATLFQASLPTKNEYFNLGTLGTGPYPNYPRFMSPEASSFLSTTGAFVSYRQQTVVCTTGTNPGNINYDGTIHSFLRAEQLDAWYKGATGATGPAAYDVSLWGTADDATKDAYNWLISPTGGNRNFLGSTTSVPTAVSTAATVLETTRLFTDQWSHPGVRNQIDNMLYLEDALASKGNGTDVLNWAMPGWDL